MNQEPIRILNLFTIMNRGGAETMVMNYYRNIDRRKVQFDFLVHREEAGVYEEEIKALGGRIYRMPPIYPQNFAKYIKKIRKFLKEHPEYKIIHSHMSELGYFVFKEAKKQHVPVIICHAHNRPYGWDVKMIMRNYFKYMMRPYITHMCMCGLESGEWLFGKKNKDKFIQINNAIDAEKFIYNKSIGDEIRKELGISDEFVVGHIGRFDIQKNHEKLIDIFCEICKINKNSKLLLIGEGQLKKSIENKVKLLNLEKNVLFLGTRSDVNRVMQAFDVFLFPSFFEGLSVSMVEAQAAGLQCFISSSIPKECIITDNVVTFDLDWNDSKIAKMIVDLHSNYKRTNTYEQILKAGFDIKNNAKELENFYIEEYKRNCN